MLPLFKVLSLLIRVCARPIAARTKTFQLQRANNHNGKSRKFFIILGNSSNKLETKINKYFLKIDTKNDFFVKPVSDEMAIEKGIEFFSEIIIYSLMFGLPCYEMWRSSVEAQLKSEKLNSKISDMEGSVVELNGLIEIDTQTLNQQRMFYEEMKQQITQIEGLTRLNRLGNLEQMSQQNNKIQELQDEIKRLQGQ